MQERYVIRTAYLPWPAASCSTFPHAEELAAYWLQSVNVVQQHRRQGYGSRLLGMVTADADMEGVVLYLQANPNYTRNGLLLPALMAWYGRHGFEPYTPGLPSLLPNQMRRFPR